MRPLLGVPLFLLTLLTVACGSKDEGSTAEVQDCEPAGACSCEPGVERETACFCEGGSECVIAGDSIEFSCDGNAGCGMDCGEDCLITCPGTTTCEVFVGANGEIDCPGTASCDVTCSSSCTVSVAGAAHAILRCEDGSADCRMEGCTPTDCGDGVYACQADCP